MAEASFSVQLASSGPVVTAPDEINMANAAEPQEIPG
jgi:hypothetical protein